MKPMSSEDREREDRRAAAMQALIGSADVAHELERKSNAELADLLLVLWASEPLTSPRSDLIDEAMTRLRATENETAGALLVALRVARDAIEALHGPEAWEIYEEHSPEMKAIRAALDKAEFIK